MMTRDERLTYLEKIDAAQQAMLSDPEIAAEYARASQAWNTTVEADRSAAQAGRNINSGQSARSSCD